MKAELNFDQVLTIATNLGYLIAGGVVCYFVVRKKLSEYFKNINQSLSVSSKVPKQAKNDVEIIKRMEQLKEVLNADRVQVYEFHNGEHYANGRSALKFTCTYEVYRVGIESTQKKMSSIPISCVPHFITQLLNEELIKVNNIESIKDEMPATYSLMQSNGVSGYQKLVIKNTLSEPVGFISVQWCEGHKPHSNDKELYRLAAFVEERILSELK